jgi:hypothetical protein
LEATALRASGLSRVAARATAAFNYALGGVYAADVAANADFRKFDDGLRMTLDCSPAFADGLEARLAAAGDFTHWGVFRQKSAQITCFVPLITDRGHVHFVEGAEGGYTLAAKALKNRNGLPAVPVVRGAGA